MGVLASYSNLLIRAIFMNPDSGVPTPPFQKSPFRDLWHNLILVLKGPGDDDFAPHRKENSIWQVLTPLLAVLLTVLFGVFDRLVLAAPAERYVRFPAMVFGVLTTLYLGVIYYKYVTPIHHVVVGTSVRRLGGWTVFLPLLTLLGFTDFPGYPLAAPTFIVVVLILTFFLAFLFSWLLRSNLKKRLRATKVQEGSSGKLSTVEEVLNGWVVINLFTVLALAFILVPFPYEWMVDAVETAVQSGPIDWGDVFAVEPLRMEWVIFLLVVISRAGGAIRSFTFKASAVYWEELKEINARLQAK